MSGTGLTIAEKFIERLFHSEQDALTEAQDRRDQWLTSRVGETRISHS